MNKSMVRRGLLAGTSVLNWIFSVGYVREIYNFIAEDNFIEYPGEIIVDGSDFTPLADLAVTGVNGMLIALTFGAYVIISTVFILIFSVLLRVVAVRKNDEVTGADVIFVKRFITISSVLAFIAGVLLSNVNLTGYVLALSWQQPLFMLLIYYRALKKKQNDVKRETAEE
ncbi:MAG: hypothetical protein K2N72_09555 [Oscillospiraceae bacterium]|nr:hypothetical protein [Oscillospiraceae bacterium]